MTSRRYANYEKAKDWAGSTFGTFTVQQAAYFEKEIAALGLLNRSALSVLEVGFGNGAFLGWLRSRGWHGTGIEINSELAERGRRQGFVIADDVDGVSSTLGHFDLIVAFDVLEHVDRDDLVQMLCALRRRSHGDTRMLFRFPNGDNPFALPFQNGDVTHRTSIGSGMMRQLATLADLELVALGAPAVSLKNTGVRRRLSLLLGLPARALVGWFIRLLFMGGASVTFSGNLVAVLKPACKRDQNEVP